MKMQSQSYRAEVLAEKHLPTAGPPVMAIQVTPLDCAVTVDDDGNIARNFAAENIVVYRCRRFEDNRGGLRGGPPPTLFYWCELDGREYAYLALDGTLGDENLAK